VAASIRLREIVGFHCQQTVEEYLKVLLTFYQIEFPKTHEIWRLLALVSSVNPEAANALGCKNGLVHSQLICGNPAMPPKCSRAMRSGRSRLPASQRQWSFEFWTRDSFAVSHSDNGVSRD
jgi:hypothetical protein